jgi:AraC-like DNA-binding protein
MMHTEANTSKLPHSSFDTTGLPPDQQFWAWREAVNVIFDTQNTDPAEIGFHTRVDGYLCGDVVLGMIETGAQRYDRSKSKIGRDGQDEYVLQFYLDGKCGQRNKGSDACARPGDLFIVDTAQPLATATTRSQFLNLVIPRRLLAPMLRSPDELNMHVLNGQQGTVALLRDHLLALYRRAHQITTADAQSILPATLHLAAAAVNSAVTEDNVQSFRACLFGSICRHLNDHLTNLELKPEKVASQFGISRATLYRMFENEGGFANYLRKQRLRRSHEILTDASRRDQSIAEIAQIYGFSSPANFTRAFRQAAGISPREARMLAMEGKTMITQLAQADDWRDWLELMR